MTAPAVASRIVMTCQDQPGTARVDLQWSDLVPFRVRMLVHLHKVDVEWWLARCLLVDGLVQETGIGDVVVRPAGDMVEIELRTSASHGVLVAHRADVEAFLEQTLAVQPSDDLDTADLDWMRFV